MASITRDWIIGEALEWIGTPYVHQASTKHVGCDCLGLVRGIWRSGIGVEPGLAPAYSPDWAERLSDDPLLKAARLWLVERPLGDARPGDVVVFRMTAQANAKHCAIITDPNTIVHAYWGRAVLKSRFVPWWRNRCVGAFSFPGIL